MPQNILLTSLDVPESNKTLRYYSVQNEFGRDYCEALQSMEASTKYILSRFPIDEIIVFGEKGSSEGVDDGKLFRLRDMDTPDPEGEEPLSAFSLYRSRIAQYIGEQSQEQQAYDELLPEEKREKLASFIRDYQEQHSNQETKRLNRFFDELAGNKEFYEQLKDALFDAFPEARSDSRTTMKWVKNYLYKQLKPTAKLEILPINENVCARYVPAVLLEKREYWVNRVLDINQDVIDGKDEINLYVSLGSNSTVDDHLVMNILNILVSTPGSNVHLRKNIRVYESSGNLAGSIEDNTAIFRTTDLVAAAHAFLNYSKTDLLVDFWENCGEHSDRISSLIYAARHVDVGISMCNITEVQEGIQLLRRLFRNDRPWTDAGYYGLLLGMIAECIQADYSALLEGDGPIPFIELIKWANKHQLYQQVLTLIESNAPNSLVSSGIFYYCDDEAQAKEITNLFALQRLEMKPYEYYKMDDLDHYFIKNYDRGSVKIGGSKGENRTLLYAMLRAQSIENQNPGKIRGCTACSNIETVQNVLYAYYHLGEVRNRISHADEAALAEQRLIVSESDISYAMIKMRESIDFFIMNYEKALAEVGDKKPKIVAITPDDVRKTADHLKYMKSQEERNASGGDKGGKWQAKPEDGKKMS